MGRVWDIAAETHAECQGEVNRLRRERQDVLDELATLKVALDRSIERVRERYPMDVLDAGGVGHDCAQVERDNLDLHQALAEALRRIQLANVERDVYRHPPIYFQDLLAVLDRTSRPEAQSPA